MQTRKVRVKRLAWFPLAGTIALLFILGLLAVISRYQVLAQSPQEVVQSGIEVVKDVGADATMPGDTLLYTITIKNHERISILAHLTDTLPVEVSLDVPTLRTLMSASQVEYEGGVITWNYDMPPVSEDQITFRVEVSPVLTHTYITNTVHAVGAGGLAASDWALTEVVAQTAVLESSAAPAQVPTPTVETGALSTDTVDVSTDTVGVGVSQTGTVSVDAEITDTTGSSGAETLLQPSASAVIADPPWYVPFMMHRWPSLHFIPMMARWYPPPLTLTPISAPDANHSYTVWWGWPEGTPLPYDQYVLQQSLTQDFATISQVWTTTVASQLVTYAYCPYYYRVRVDNFSRWGVGAWSNIQAAQGSSPKPVLNTIPAPDPNGSYTVSWQPIPGYSPDWYVLQESTTADFATFTEWVVAGTSKLIEKGTAIGTWYYRVRADDGCWGQGPWSDSKKTSTVYYDDFSNSSSGWPVFKKLVIPETDSNYRARYDNGHYRIMVDPGGPQIWFHQPDALAPYRPPTDKYCAETLVKLYKMQPPYNKRDWDYYPFWGNGGLVFGASEQNDNIYALCITVGTDADQKIGWMIVNNPDYKYPRYGCNYLGGVKGGEGSSLATGEWHLFQVGVDGNLARVYVDGAYKGTFYMPGLSGTTRVGLIGGDYEITPADFHFDYFKITPNADCGPY